MREIKSYTHIWKVDGVLYNLGDIKLPFSLSHRYIGWLAGSAVIVWMFNKLPPISLINSTLLKLLLPFGLAWLMSSIQFGGKTAKQYLTTQLTYYLRPRTSCGGRTIKPKQIHKVRSDITIVRKDQVRDAPNKIH